MGEPIYHMLLDEGTDSWLGAALADDDSIHMLVSQRDDFVLARNLPQSAVRQYADLLMALVPGSKAVTIEMEQPVGVSDTRSPDPPSIPSYRWWIVQLRGNNKEDRHVHHMLGWGVIMDTTPTDAAYRLAAYAHTAQGPGWGGPSGRANATRAWVWPITVDHLTTTAEWIEPHRHSDPEDFSRALARRGNDIEPSFVDLPEVGMGTGPE